MRKRNLTLVGPMGAGKSTIGRLLARELGLPFKDSDREIEERTGANIALIFELEGEQGFREREQQLIGELMREKGMVLATGGGAILRSANRAALMNATKYLLHTRLSISRADTRDAIVLATNKNPRQYWRSVKIREPLTGKC